jgi:hypothetical protein
MINNAITSKGQRDPASLAEGSVGDGIFNWIHFNTDATYLQMKVNTVFNCPSQKQTTDEITSLTIYNGVVKRNKHLDMYVRRFATNEVQASALTLLPLTPHVRQPM